MKKQKKKKLFQKNFWTFFKNAVISTFLAPKKMVPKSAHKQKACIIRISK